MPTSDFFLIGGGGHAKVVLAAWECRESVNISVWDDDLDLEGKFCLDVAINVPVAFDALPPLGHVAIGSNAVRRRLATAIVDSGRALQTVRHPTASVACYAKVADGVFVAANAVIGPEAKVGRGTIINHGAIVDHDCQVGAFAHIAPNVALGGGVTIGEGCFIGAGAVILPGLTIADQSVIGAGAVVTTDVNIKGTTVKGIPAR